MQFTDAWFARVTDGQQLPPQASQFIRSDSAAAWASRIHSEIHQKDAMSTLAIDGAMNQPDPIIASRPTAVAGSRR